MGTVVIEFNCPKHGFERFKIKVTRKYNIGKNDIIPKFRTRPTYELQGIFIGKSVQQEEVKSYLVHYFRHAGIMKDVISVRFQL